MSRPTPKIGKIYQKLSTNKSFARQARNLQNKFKSANTTEELAELNKEKQKLIHALAEEFKIYPRDLHREIIQKIIGGKTNKNDSFGISHYINKNMYDDMDYRTVEIIIEAGATQSEVIRYIQKHWKEMNKELKVGLESTDYGKKRLRRKTFEVRDKKIFSLHKKGFSDKEISEKLQMGGQLSLIRKVISNMKKQGM